MKELKNKNSENNYSSNPNDSDKVLESWDEIFEFQARKDGANYMLLKNWLKKYYNLPTLKN